METMPSASNEAILEQLKCGVAEFELTSSPLPSVCNLGRPSYVFSGGNPCSFFAKIGPSLNGGSPALKKVERYSVRKVTGDGRCLFRALVKGMAVNKGIPLTLHKEKNDADELRMAVKEVICVNDSERRRYKEAVIAITVDQPLKHYCQQIGRSDFWGGEPELLLLPVEVFVIKFLLHTLLVKKFSDTRRTEEKEVLSKLCSQPIIVYIPEHEHRGQGFGFIPIAEYGSEYRESSREGKSRKVVRLLYSGKNHYDLLV